MTEMNECVRINYANICITHTPEFRGCTGFDGGFAIEAAICGPGPHSKPELNIKADENLAYAA